MIHCSMIRCSMSRCSMIHCSTTDFETKASLWFHKISCRTMNHRVTFSAHLVQLQYWKRSGGSGFLWCTNLYRQHQHTEKLRTRRWCTQEYFFPSMEGKWWVYPCGSDGYVGRRTPTDTLGKRLSTVICIWHWIFGAATILRILSIRSPEEFANLYFFSLEYGLFVCTFLRHGGSESRGGQMLIAKADFHLGSKIEKFVRLRMNTGSKVQKHAAIFGTYDGGIGCIAPVEEPVFKRLFTLQNKLANSLPHFAGLNPKAFRTMKTEHKVLRNHYGNILDGELLFKYVTLYSKCQQVCIPRHRGAT